jgi:hypothetical protein
MQENRGGIMTHKDVQDLIFEVFNYDEYPSGERGRISATGLLGPKYKALKIITNCPKDPALLKPELRRSSTIGTAFHQYVEKVVKKLHPEAITEIRMEKKVGDITVTGAVDLLVPSEDRKYIICDWKTGYGKLRKQELLDKDAKQLSIYRWLLSPHIETEDVGYTLFVSQSNNAQAAIDNALMDVSETQEWVEDMIFAIEHVADSGHCDCFDNVKYNPCSYCEFVCDHRKT